MNAPSNNPERQTRMQDIAKVLGDIERAHATPGQETIPSRERSRVFWEYGHASSWVTLYRDGGWSNQPAWYQRDMEWYDMWDTYHRLQAEYNRHDAALKKGG